MSHSHQQQISRQNKVHCKTEVAIALRQAALRRGTTMSDVVRKLVEDHLEVPTKDDLLVETNKRGRVAARYLSNTLSDCVQQLAAQSGCSQSWIIRDLLRQSLRERGLLPLTSTAAAADVIETSSG